MDPGVVWAVEAGARAVELREARDVEDVVGARSGSSPWRASRRSTARRRRSPSSRGSGRAGRACRSPRPAAAPSKRCSRGPWSGNRRGTGSGGRCFRGRPGSPGPRTARSRAGSPRPPSRRRSRRRSGPGPPGRAPPSRSSGRTCWPSRRCPLPCIRAPFAFPSFPWRREGGRSAPSARRAAARGSSPGDPGR